MTRSELINKISESFPKLQQHELEAMIILIINNLTQALAEKRRIEIRGFGSFDLKKRAARVGRNPKSGERVQVGEKHVPRFKAGKILRAKVNNKH